MKCVQCGAELRPNARFCNVCGAHQPAESASHKTDTNTDTNDAAESEPGRMKRPPRVLRATDEAEEESADATTVKQPTVSAASAPEPILAQTQPTSAAQPTPPAETPTGEPSWPLAEGAIVAGRFRVAAVVSAAESPAGDNVYRASDLRGAERCWSCGKSYGPEDEPQRFCPECGADMLGRDYLLRERMASGQPDTMPEGTTGAFVAGGRAYQVAPEVAEAAPFPRGLKIVIGSASDIGISRQEGHNEDTVGHVIVEVLHDSYAEPLALAVVADGLGGHASGREASRMVVRTLLDHVVRDVAGPTVGAETDAPLTEEELKRILREGIQAANVALCDANTAQQLDMGSTVVAALLYEGTAYLANVGDSRGYILEGDTLRRITTDHSFVEQLIAGGIILPEDRYTHPQRNQIFRSLGLNPQTEVDFFTQKLRPGMRLLLCSDGLWEMVRDDEMARILNANGDPQAACAALIAAANKAGGEDNISAMIVQVGG